MGRISSRAIIFNDDETSVLLMFRKKLDKTGVLKEYYAVPGGGLEDNESLENCAIRELHEEMNIKIKVLGYVGLETTPQGFSNYYHAQIIEGTPTLSGEELERMTNENYYEPQFVKFEDLSKFTVFAVEFIMLAKNKEYVALNNAVLTNQGICPTCYNRQFDNVVFGNTEHMVIFRNSKIEAFFVSDPRAVGHVAIFSNKHYKDMLEADTEIIPHIFKFAQVAMVALKKHLQCESVYLCTMCDGPNNHFHLQLIPRYDYEERGSKNFVKPRAPYVHNQELTQALRTELETTFTEE